MLGLVVFHDGGLAPVVIPGVGRAFLPAVERRLVEPLVILPPQNERVLFPDQALPHLESDVVAGSPEIVSFGIGVENVTDMLEVIARSGIGGKN